jgi:hypothetical protein
VSERREREKKKMEAFRQKARFMVNHWKGEGYNTTTIDEVLDEVTDLDELKEAFKEFKQGVYKLKALEAEILKMDTIAHKEEVTRLKEMLHDVEAIEDLEEGIQELRKKVEKTAPVIEGPTREDFELLEKKVKIWKIQGYHVFDLLDFLRKTSDIKKAEEVVAKYEKKIGVTKKIDMILDSLEAPGLESDISRIRKKIKKLKDINEIWDEVRNLKKEIQKRKKEIVTAETKIKPVKVTKTKIVKKVRKIKEPGEEEKPTPEVEEIEEQKEIVEFRRIDLYVQMLQEILMANKRILTLDTIRLAQRALKKEHPKIMFFIVQHDFKIRSMMPDHPDSYVALEAFLNRMFQSLTSLVGESEAKDLIRKPAKEFITTHIQEILASGIDDYFPVFLILGKEDMPEEVPEKIPIEEEDEWSKIEEKVLAWKEQGYVVTRLEQAMGENRELAMAIYRKTEEEIFWLKELEKDVKALEGKASERDLEEIKRKLKYPDKINEIEDDILSLQMKMDIDEDGLL